MEEGTCLVTRRGVRVPSSALAWRFDRASGPGGQHRNTTMTRARATVDLSLLVGPPELLERVRSSLGAVVEMSECSSRSQWQNRERLLERLRTLLDDAAAAVKQRRRTRPGRAAIERRLDEKRRNAERKRSRRLPQEG